MSTETTKTDTYIHLIIAIFTHYFTQANRTHIITEHINDFQKHRLESIFLILLLYPVSGLPFMSKLIRMVLTRLFLKVPTI